MKPNAIQRIPPPAWVALGLVVVLAVALTFQPVRALAEDFLALFRVEQIRVVQVNSEKSPDKLESSSNLEYILSNQVQLEEQGETQQAADLAEATALVGFTPRLPVEIEGEPEFTVHPAGNLSLVVDLELVRAVLKDIDREDIKLPDELDGAVVQVRIPASLSASFGDCIFRAYPAPVDPDEPEAEEWDFRSCTKLMQVPSPAVSAPPDLDLNQIGEAYLQLFGMDAEEAASFARSVNWTTTFVIPLPRYDADYEEVQVDGVSGTLIYDYGMANENYTLIWIKDGFIYALSGWGGRSAALKIAGSIQ